MVRGLPRLRQAERFVPWLFTIARRTVTDHLRQTYEAPETAIEVWPRCRLRSARC
ncbi:sigma factor [Streptomyces sp. M92]|uniref:sigma factor n=1 Tax=Streptomyces sp. M92 TaxID=2944250 RepID=UPI00234980E7|nr:sigma factor [Streptomyces sp. M92]